MIASLPMYDRPETRAANDRLWTLIRKSPALQDARPPDTLTWSSDLWAHWLSPDLFLSQTCGLPYRTRLHGRVTLVATPVHDLPCPPGCYVSVLVVRRSDGRKAVEDFAAATLAVNDGLSQSGWAAPHSLAESHGFRFARTTMTGAHRASAAAVAAGKADLAALDAVTWRMIRRWDDFAADLRVLTETPPTPALPYIAARGQDADALFAAIREAIHRLDPADRAALCLTDLAAVPVDRYLAIPTPPLPGNAAADSPASPLRPGET